MAFVMKNKDTVLFLCVWEQLNNPGFNSPEFEGIKNEAGRNSFFLSAKKWADATGGFESLKQTDKHNAGYWRARDLQPLLGYAQWRRFKQAIDRAKASWETSGNNLKNHFAGAGKMVVGGVPARKRCGDYSMAANLSHPKKTIGVSLW